MLQTIRSLIVPAVLQRLTLLVNHLLMAEQAGLGVAELAQIDVRGEAIEKVKSNFG